MSANKTVNLPTWAAPASLAEARNQILNLGRSLHEHAFILGRTLAWVKSEVGHGRFGKWLNDNVWFNERTARRFIAFSLKCSEAGKLFTYSTKTDIMSDLKEPEIAGDILAMRVAWLYEHWDELGTPDEQNPFLADALPYLLRQDEINSERNALQARWADLDSRLDSTPPERQIEELSEFIHAASALEGEAFANNIYLKGEYGKLLNRLADDERDWLLSLQARLAVVTDEDQRKAIEVDFVARHPGAWIEA